MTCPNEGRLRALLDTELPVDERHLTTMHIESCHACQRRLRRLEESRSWTGQRMAALPVASARMDRLPWAVVLAKSQKRGIQKMKRLPGFWRPVLIGAAILTLLVTTYTFAPTQTLARQLLSVFRVRKFAVVRVSPDEATIEQTAEQIADSLFVREPEPVVDAPVLPASSPKEASELAGFEVRMPAYWPDRMHKIEVKGRSEYAIPFTRQGLVILLELAGMDAGQIPDGWEEATATIIMPAAVSIQGDNIQIMQALDPSVEYPGGINPGLIGEAGLRLLGVSPTEAKRIAHTIDWTTTMLLPVPADVREFAETQIAGEDAILVRPKDYHGDNQAALVFHKGDVIYVVTGRVSSDRLVEIAASLFQ